MERKAVGYRVIYMPGSEDGEYPLFNTKEEAYAFIDGLCWYCKISKDEHPCRSCSAEYMVFEESRKKNPKRIYTREKVVFKLKDNK